jgi:taurine dioxygenase
MLDVTPLQDGLPFGARIGGVTLARLEDPAVRAQINDLFEKHGMIVFADVEPTAEMHIALSDVFGPMKDHPSKAVARVDQNSMPGVIDMICPANADGTMLIGGKRLISWLPWHFDHCCNNELNRAGVLRAIDIPPEGGLTSFVDGIQLYQSLSPELRERIEGRNILYKMNVVMSDMRFGQPEGYQVESERDGAQAVMDAAKGTPRALHPAVWTRRTGEKVLHVSPWMAEGIQGQEDAEGYALLEAISQEIYARAQAYTHKWNLTDMLIWDNWRMLHSVSGHDPKYSRRMQRTTIKGDYGLGRFENDGTGSKVLEMTF